MPTVLITGAGRGIGLELARQYRADGWQVIGTVRNPASGGDLKAAGVEVEALEAADPASIVALGDRMKGRAIDVMIANAGMMGDPATIEPAEWIETLKLNSIGPTLLALALKDAVLASDQKKMVAITSRLGSIAQNSAGSYVAYRSSKAALNAAWRSLSIDWRGSGLALAMLHPGWVRTAMGGSNAEVAPEDSAAGLRRVIAALTPDRSGTFIAFDGEELPW